MSSNGASALDGAAAWWSATSASLAPKLSALQSSAAEHMSRAQSVAAEHVSRAKTHVETATATHAPNLRAQLSKVKARAAELAEVEIGAEDLLGIFSGEGLSQRGAPSGSRARHTYVSERVIAMPFPFSREEAAVNARLNCIDDVASFLNEAHENHYMVWNLSERTYDESRFGDQVICYTFPGHPAPPLGLLYLVCNSVRSWLAADARNVAVVHCLSGQGRTSIVCAAILLWLDPECDTAAALEAVAERQQSSAAELTLPSQRRYFNYFACVANGIVPETSPLRLVAVRVRGAPAFVTESSSGEEGCRSYFQIVQNGKVTWSSFSAGP